MSFFVLNEVGNLGALRNFGNHIYREWCLWNKENSSYPFVIWSIKENSKLLMIITCEFSNSFLTLLDQIVKEVWENGFKTSNLNCGHKFSRRTLTVFPCEDTLLIDCDSKNCRKAGGAIMWRKFSANSLKQKEIHAKGRNFSLSRFKKATTYHHLHRTLHGF